MTSIPLGPEAEERFRAGVALLREIAGDTVADGVLANHQTVERDVRGDLLDWAVGTSFGYLYQRPGLSMRDRAIAVLGVDIGMMRSRGALREHVKLALLSGVTPEELFEICFVLVWYCGMPTIREVLDEVRAVLESSSTGDDTMERSSGGPESDE